MWATREANDQWWVFLNSEFVIFDFMQRLNWQTWTQIIVSISYSLCPPSGCSEVGRQRDMGYGTLLPVIKNWSNDNQYSEKSIFMEWWELTHVFIDLLTANCTNEVPSHCIWAERFGLRLLRHPVSFYSLHPTDIICWAQDDQGKRPLSLLGF